MVAKPLRTTDFVVLNIEDKLLFKFCVIILIVFIDYGLYFAGKFFYIHSISKRLRVC